MSVVTFWLGSEEYGFPVTEVVEMTPAASVTRVPGAPPRVAGITTWRGRTIPVLDLRAHLKLEDSPPDVKSRLLVLDRPGPFAVLVERPGRILTTGEIRPVESPARGSEDAFTLMQTEDGLVRVLDPLGLFPPGDGAPRDTAPDPSQTIE